MPDQIPSQQPNNKLLPSKDNSFSGQYFNGKSVPEVKKDKTDENQSPQSIIVNTSKKPATSNINSSGIQVKKQNSEPEDMFAQIEEPEPKLVPQQEEPESPPAPETSQSETKSEESSDKNQEQEAKPIVSPKPLPANILGKIKTFKQEHPVPAKLKSLETGFSHIWKKIVLVIFIILILTGGILYIFYWRFGKLDLKVQPNDVKIYLSGIDYSANNNQGYKKVKTGTYDLLIKKDGFIEYTKKIIIAYKNDVEINVSLINIPKAILVSDKKLSHLKYVENRNELLAYSGDNVIFYVFKLKTDIITDENTSLNLKAESATPNKMKGIKNVIWQPNADLAIFQIDNSAKLDGTPFAGQSHRPNSTSTWLYDFKRYDLLHQEAKFWSDNIGDLVWTADGEKIIYYYNDPKTSEKTLVRATKDNNNQERIYNFADEEIDNPVISLSSDDKFLTIVPRGKDYSKNFVYILDMYSKKLSKIVESGDNKGVLTSPDARFVVFSKFNKELSNTVITISDSEGKNKFDLEGISSIKKVMWKDNENILRAKIETGKSDTLEKINVKTKDIKKYYFISQDLISFENIYFNKQGASIFFLSQNKIYYLNLKTNDY